MCFVQIGGQIFSWWLFSLVEFGLLYNTPKLMMFLSILIFKNKFSQKGELFVLKELSMFSLI